MNKFSAFLVSPLESQQITLVNLLAHNIEELKQSNSNKKLNFAEVEQVKSKFIEHFQFNQLSNCEPNKFASVVNNDFEQACKQGGAYS